MNTLSTKQLFKPAAKARLHPFYAIFRHKNGCSRCIYCLSSYEKNSKLVKTNSVTLPNASSQPAGENLPIVQWGHDSGRLQLNKPFVSGMCAWKGNGL